MSNLKKFLSDPHLWEEPAVFSPERLSNIEYTILSDKIVRFLDSCGKFTKPEHFVPLGHGRRVCLGEPLAKAELFIFFTTLVQNLKFDKVDGKEPDPSNYSVGVTKYPNEFIVNSVRRNLIQEN